LISRSSLLTAMEVRPMIRTSAPEWQEDSLTAL
jgi:hypothetical protein